MLSTSSIVAVPVHKQSLTITFGPQEDSFQSGTAVVCADNVTIDSLVSVVRCPAAPITGRYITIQAKDRDGETLGRTVLNLCNVHLYAQGKQLIAFLQKHRCQG